MAPAPGTVGVGVGAVVGVAALDTIGTVAAGSVDEALTAGSADVVLTAASADGALRTIRVEASMAAQAAFMAEAVDSTGEVVADSTAEVVADSTAVVADTGNR